MSKKYLLYIHDERFAEEPQKSGLVNLLLSRHYDYFKPGTLVEELPGEDQGLHKDAIIGNGELRTVLEKECKGTHYMSREDCGKIGCPWRK